MFKPITFATLLLTVGFYFQNCSKVNFSSIPVTQSQAQGSPSNCTTVIQNYTGNLRIIFMVDDSGSTAQTDPNFYYREQTVSEFITQYSGKTNFTYAFGEFGNDSVSVYDNATGTFDGTPATPFGTAADLQNALSFYVAHFGPNGDTPYQLAFTALANMIQNDTASGTTAPDYSVVFMSDGMPDPNNTISQLKSMVDGVLSAASARSVAATVSTVYFGTEVSKSDMTAMNNLEVMATEGNGQFYDTNNPPPGGLVENVVTIPGQSQVCTD